jgi:hypothetical protein
MGVFLQKELPWTAFPDQRFSNHSATGPFVPFPTHPTNFKVHLEQHLGEGCLGERPVTL